MNNAGTGATTLAGLTALRAARLIGHRYQLINELGHGGMGSVYRALDRLTGRVVTLKRLKVPEGRCAETADDTSWEDRMSLAREFRLLASLRHPNIISVLDYGFDEDGQPFLTMDLQENAQTIIQAGGRQPLALRVDLLVQTLRALVYLHRQGIIHRDFKPENVLVVKDQVKILDFGLSAYRHPAGTEGVPCAGTLAYMAPEVLRGASPSERSDLYAVGVIAWELLAGGNNSAAGNLVALHRQRVQTARPAPGEEIDPRLRPTLQRLLAERPEARYRDAGEVILALAAALGQPFPVETVATRESFLQAAPFVGRVDELATVIQILRDAKQGSGGAWLVGGESGVGKSRFLEEVRTWALVEGVVVVRGQAVSQGGGPYHVWRDVVSNLLLRVDLNDAQAGVLKAVVPEIGALVGREIADAPAVDSEATQSRLLFTVEEVFRLQPGPVVIILEDLQWAGSESLDLWNWLVRSTKGRPLLLLASFRNDEAAELPKALSATNVLTLRRLETDEIAALSETMIGSAGRRPDLIALLERETEGIPFFIVEVMRTLAEGTGRLDQIGAAQFPARVISGGMQKVIRRRLNQVPVEALPPLKTAAIIGKVVDPRLMQAVHPRLVLENWSASCAAAAVLELRDQQWRFAHDKLREQLLEDLSGPSRRHLHRQVAEAIEHEYPGRPDRVTALAHHWRQAGDPTREATYADQAGVLALQSGACREAIAYFNRTLELLRLPSQQPVPTEAIKGAAPPVDRWRMSSWLDPNTRVDPDSAVFRLGMIEGGLTEAYYRLGDLAGCRQHALRALVHFGQHVPADAFRWFRGAARQLALRALQTLLRVRSADQARTRRVASEVARVQIKLTETFFYSMQALPLIWSALRLVNQCEPAGPSPNLGQGYMMIALLAGVAPLRVLADAWARRALEITERTGTSRDVACILSRIAVLQLAACRWDDAEAGLGRAIAIAEEVGDLRLWEECHSQTAALALFTGQLERGLGLFRDAVRLTRRSGNRQIECWGLMGQADMLIRLGRNDEAVKVYREGVALIDKDALRTEAIWGFGMFALACLRSGDRQGAYDSARRALRYVLTTKPVAYWTQHGTAATAEVLVSLLQSSAELDDESRVRLAADARQACRGLRRYARTFPLGRPHAYLWEGLRSWLAGRPRRAFRLWRKSIRLAERLRTPYERGRAHFEIGRHLPPDDESRRHHLTEAVEAFEQLGCATDLQRARTELASSRRVVLSTAASP